MVRVFPQLAEARIDTCLGRVCGYHDEPCAGFRTDRCRCVYLQGFSGHGIALTGLAGKLVAEAVAGQSERFDVFAKIPHREFPGGALLRRPALVLAMLYYRLRDLL